MIENWNLILRNLNVEENIQLVLFINLIYVLSITFFIN